MSTEPLEPPIPVVEQKYVAFCDVLGFSHAVENHFDETIELYAEFMHRMREWPFPEKANISVYSDSILIVCSELAPVLHAVQSLSFATLAQNWLIRGGIAYGRYWENRQDGSLFVVSDALVRAVHLEATVGIPAVVISPEVEIPIAAWVARFAHGPYGTPVLHYNGTSLVNPFNPYWFASAKQRVSQLQSRFPQHEDKYRWFLGLANSVERDETLVPDSIVQELLKLRVIQQRPDDAHSNDIAG
ncbi:MAG TPA: hypothetical protein PKD38_18940 [Nitrospira sp.]|nr:hypothetical protein [Nitrospira sp.]